MGSDSHSRVRQQLCALGIILLMLTVSLTHIQFSNLHEQETVSFSNNQPWDDLQQPWGQYGGTATRNGSMQPIVPLQDRCSASMTQSSTGLHWMTASVRCLWIIIGDFSASLSATDGV